MHEAHQPAMADVEGAAALRVICSCGWVGPPRYVHDPAYSVLVADDRDWHDEQISKGPH